MDRSVLARKPMTELRDIASHLQMRGFQKLRKADLIEAIVTHATGSGDSNGSATEAAESPAQIEAREETARKVLPPGARTRDAGDAAETAPAATDDSRQQDTSGRDTSGRDTSGKDTSGKDTSGKDTSGKDTAGRGRVRPERPGRDTGSTDRDSGRSSSRRSGAGTSDADGPAAGASDAGTASETPSSETRPSEAESSGNPAESGRSRTRRTTSGSGDGSSSRRRNRGQAPDEDAEATASADQSTQRAPRRGRNTTDSQDADSGSQSAAARSADAQHSGKKDAQASDNQDAVAADDDDQDDSEESSASRKRRNRRDRRKRNRDRTEQEAQTGNEQGEVRAGVLDVLPEGYGFLRTTGYLPGDRDVYVSQGQIRKHALRRGDVVQGPIRQQRNNEKVPALHHVQKVNGDDLVAGRAPERVEFRDLVPLYPSERLRLETDKGPTILRCIDLLSPFGKGQRALLIAPPGAGRTDTITGMGRAIAENNPEVHLMVLLIDERPEDVTEVERALPGEVIASTFNRPTEDHTQIAELALERAKRLVELGHDVVILLDSLTRLARAYGGGGVDSTSLYPAKRFFGAARNIEDGGSLTIIAATLVDTGSATDDTISEEFIGTANAITALQGALPPHLRPALDVAASGTRREELMVDDEDLQAMWALRRSLEPLAPGEASQTLGERVAESSDNASLIASLQKDGAS